MRATHLIPSDSGFSQARRYQNRTLFACLVMMAAIQLGWAASLFVDGRHVSPPFNGSELAPYATIGAAIEAAQTGDEIRIAVGQYAENLLIQDKSLQLSGGWLGGESEDYADGGAGGRFDIRAPEGEWTHVSGAAAAPVILLQEEGASGSVIERMHLTGGLHGIAMPDWPPLTDLVIRDNWIQNNGRPETERDVLDGAGILLSGERIHVLNNLVQGNQGGLGAGIAANVVDIEVIGNRFVGNDGYSDHGGGVSLSGSGLVRGNLIANNRIGVGVGYGWGGGITVFGRDDLGPEAKFILENNEIRDNFAPTAGGGLFVDEAAVAEARHELIHHNRVDANGNGGAGVYVDGAGSGTEGAYSRALFEFCTIADNTGRDGDAGNGLLVEFSYVTAVNCIFYGNLDDFFFNGEGSFEVAYCLSDEFIAGEGNQNSDPLFADAASADYHLKSRHGRWDPSTAQWVADAVHSPGIDAGSSDAPFDLEPAPNGERANLGVYGNSVHASQTDIENSPPTDIVLSPAEILENQPIGTLVGMLRVVDPNSEDSHDIGLASGEGDADNDVFDLRDGGLFARLEFDFESKQTYSVRVQAGDRRGGVFAKVFVISILDVEEGNFIRRRLQQGLEGYAGVQDTYISAEDWDTPPQYLRNYGQSESIIVSRDGGESLLIRFDLSQIPANSAVSEARLELYNTTPSDGPVRRVTAHSMLRDWAEGNRANAPLEASGDRGATGDFAVFDADNTDLNVPWGARGMQEGEDFEGFVLDTAEVAGEGWQGWDILELAKEWVAGRRDNFGVTLRDATGYDERQEDSRVFHSSQRADQPELRPRLLIVFNPLTPKSDAGPDQFIADWPGGAISLNGSASRSQDGVSTVGLNYRWRIVKAAWGSELEGEIYNGSEAVVPFQPDVAGDWEFELEAANLEGESATDRFASRLWKIGGQRPRIHLNPEKTAALRLRIDDNDPRWTQLTEWLDNTEESQWDRIALARGNALGWVLTGNNASGRTAIEMALREIALPGIDPAEPGQLALIYDWCHELLTDEERSVFLEMFETWAEDVPKSEDISGWTNYWPRYGYSYAMIGLAAFGDHPSAVEWMREFRDRRFESFDLPALNRIAEGGGWPEGMVYDWIANPSRLLALDAWQSATGERLFQSSDWFRERIDYFLLHRLPGLAQQFSITYHPYLATGDSERGRGSLAVLERLMSLILLDHFPNHPSAPALNDYLLSGPAANMDRDHFMEEFLWSNPKAPRMTPTRTAHFAEPLGSVLMRSGWPDGAADTDPTATYATFQCGDHFSYHQHLEQNSFTLYKGAPLLIDSGVYSGDGLSFHDMNYYIRAIAHNTLAVYNPDETFDRLRDGVRSNDGGQRDFQPAPRTPTGADQHLLEADSYETGDILRYESDARLTYAMGDATRAYNCVAYNQAGVDPDRPGNVAKLSMFQREFVYLRADSRRDDEEFFLVYDRVEVPEAWFSGENTKLLFHFLEEPVLDNEGILASPGELLHANAGQLTVQSGDSRLDMDFLFPEQRNLRKVGGRGVKDFWVFGTNYNWHWDEAEAAQGPVTDFDPTPWGEWRVELEPADDALSHTFLTVMRPVATPLANRLETAGIATELIEGALLKGTREDRLVLFARDANGLAEDAVIDLNLPLSVDAKPLRYYVFNARPGAVFHLESEVSGDQTRFVLQLDAAGSLLASAQGVVQGVIGDSGVGGGGIVDWLEEWFPGFTGNVTELISKDSDGDGWLDIEEYVWNLDPTKPEGAPTADDRLRIERTPDGSQWSWTLLVTQPVELPDDVEVGLEFSSDLLNWSAAMLPPVRTETSETGDRLMHQWESDATTLTQPEGFYRWTYKLLTP